MTGAAARRSGAVISASELAEFAYCHHSWWLRHVKGVAPANAAALARGRALHESHGQSARYTGLLSRAAFLLLAAALITLAVGIILIITSAGGGA